MRFVVSTEFHEVGIDVDRMPASENDPPRCVPADARGAAQAREFVQELFDRERKSR
jgi:hypothetical protein